MPNTVNTVGDLLGTRKATEFLGIPRPSAPESPTRSALMFTASLTRRR